MGGWVVGRRVVGRGSWVVGRGSWVVGRGSCLFEAKIKKDKYWLPQCSVQICNCLHSN